MILRDQFMEDIYLEKEEVVSSMEYKGFKLNFYFDDYGQQFYTKFNGEIISFGTFNSNYKEEAKYIIDKYLYEIPTKKYWDFKSPYFGSSLTWFKNKETNKWNIQLSSRGREIHTWKYAIPQEEVKGEIPPKLNKQEIETLIKASEIFLNPYIK